MNGPYVVPLVPARVILMVPELIPAQSSATVTLTEAVERTFVALVAGELVTNQGTTGLLIVLLKIVLVLVFLSCTLPVMTIGFSIP